MPATTAPDLHLYLLVGQSNMAGRGAVDAESRATHPRVVVLTKGLEWAPATDPLHFDKPIAGVGPGLAFGKAMAEASPAARIGLIPCAVGGTSIDAWVPGAADAATSTHPYDDMLLRARAALRAGVLAGIIWHQGEADRNTSADYGRRLAVLVARLRTDLAAPRVPFIAGQLPVFTQAHAEHTPAFNAVVQGMGATIPRYACVAADGLGHTGDELHLDAASARELGRRYAARMIALQREP